MFRTVAATMLVLFVLKGECQTLNQCDTLLFSWMFTAHDNPTFLHEIPALDMPSCQIITVNTVASDLNKVYLVDEEGNTASQGFAPVRYFRPNNNFLVVKGSATFSDSFNPYGALNIGEAIFLGAINRFITGINRGKRRSYSAVPD